MFFFHKCFCLFLFIPLFEIHKKHFLKKITTLQALNELIDVCNDHNGFQHHQKVVTRNALLPEKTKTVSVHLIKSVHLSRVVQEPLTMSGYRAPEIWLIQNEMCFRYEIHISKSESK